jgi:hypothetical protein
MHYTSLKLYGNEYWRLGYYDGIKQENWDSYVKQGFGNGAKDPTWKYVPEKDTKWELFYNDPCPKYDQKLFDKLSLGFVWATVPPPYLLQEWEENENKIVSTMKEMFHGVNLVPIVPLFDNLGIVRKGE